MVTRTVYDSLACRTLECATEPALITLSIGSLICASGIILHTLFVGKTEGILALEAFTVGAVSNTLIDCIIVAVTIHICLHIALAYHANIHEIVTIEAVVPALAIYLTDYQTYKK